MPLRVSERKTLAEVQRKVKKSHKESLRQASLVPGVNVSKLPDPQVVMSLPRRGGVRRSGTSETGQNVGGKLGKVQTVLSKVGLSVTPSTRVSFTAVQPRTSGGFAGIEKTERHEVAHHVLAQLGVSRSKQEEAIAKSQPTKKSVPNLRLLPQAKRTINTPTREQKGRLGKARQRLIRKKTRRNRRRR